MSQKSREAEAEAWVRKPKRTTHNVVVMILLVLAVNVITLALPYWLFNIVFSTPYMPQHIMIAWAVACVVYGALDYHANQERK